ncbi:MAG: membrane lipoprotein lipid attachment site-containing protein [Lachnospiraceae bacterium]|nr:membrane lipoprotein lipid attachment site-containing protein [Lachnospiraceae bacterium]
MKKIIPFILIMLLLAACVNDPHPHGTDETVQSTAETRPAPTEDGQEPAVAANKAVNGFPEAVLALAEDRAGTEPGYELGTGIYANVLTDAGIEESEAVDLYPLFRDGELDAVIYRNGEYEMTDDRDKLEKIGKMLEGKFSVVHTDEGTAFVGSDEIVGIDEGKIREQLEENKRIIAIQNGRLKENPFGSLKTRVRKAQNRNEVRDPETGKTYSSSRIVITLADDAGSDTISQIEKQLGITLLRKQNGGKICVFTTGESKYLDELKELVEKALEIKGVEKAGLDAANAQNSRLNGRRRAT